MDPVLTALAGLAALLGLMFLHVPLGVAMAAIGFTGFVWLTGNARAGLSLFGTETAATFSSQDLAVIPMFLLMGGFAGAAGLSADVYKLAHAFVGHRRGGLSMATVAGCGGFGAVCGSSIATTVTMARIALPEMEKRGYAQSISTGSIAGGGTLGILIPPSIIMVLYAFLTEQFVINLFVAAIIPGLIAILLYFVAIAIYVRVHPEAAPPGPRVSWVERWRVMRECWGIVLIVALVSGGIYTGVFTVVEAAAVGVGLTFAFAVFRGRLTWRVFWTTLFETAALVGMLYTVIIGARIFTYFITLSHMPDSFVQWVSALGLAPMLVVSALIVMYIVLGSVFDEVALMVLTLPFVFPLIVRYGLDPVWWGIVNVMVIEIGMICPPVGLNVFVLHGMRKDISLGTIYRGIVPFLCADVVRLALILIFPAIVLWLPQMMKG